MKYKVLILGGQSSSIKIWVFTSLECVIKKICHGVKQNAKICAIGETECNETLSLYLRKTKNWSEEKEGMVEREKREIQTKWNWVNNLKRRIRNIDTFLIQLPHSASSRHCVSLEFPTRFCSKALQTWSIILQRNSLVKGLARRD